ncbi:ribonuclease HII [Anaeromassilibacillus senegalensis]|uniref:Ribonuclease HII n=1 Tax=Anaeromassilibacillus senegalensis TaxID=1673717 RepID=A0ABS9CML6_9FIRM|nr:ribonuclease HII [Anaeromassilibacillus senegalensis]MCF2651586.1 ribonuclease HII [Anaeromassilibacillus senegalensis]
MDYTYEHNAYLRGYTAVCGIDEAGRGPLAGPVYAAAVWLPEGLVLDGLNDSKKLSEKKREALFPVILENAVSYGIGFATEQEIDEINILQATFLAMRRAFDAMQKRCDYALIDGNRMPPLPVPGETIVKGDAKSPSVAAASILAKVSRDRVMLEYAKQYPEYQFEKHKGYGTKVHVEALHTYGPSPIHRKTFLKKILG